MKYFILSIFLFISSISNAQGLLTKFGINQANKSFAISYYEKDNKRVAVVPMLHVNKPAFYQMTKRKIDSLRDEGYKVFYESIETNVKDSVELDIYMRKFRFITGIALMDYMDEKNEAFKGLQKGGYISQNDVDYGVNESIDIRTDLNLEDLVIYYEQEYGEIKLNNCDYSTQLGKKYNCSKIDENRVFYILNTLRDNYVLNEIDNTSFEKVVLVFGRNHIMDIHSKIQKRGWLHKKEKTERIKNF